MLPGRQRKERQHTFLGLHFQVNANKKLFQKHKFAWLRNGHNDMN